MEETRLPVEATRRLCARGRREGERLDPGRIRVNQEDTGGGLPGWGPNSSAGTGWVQCRDRRRDDGEGMVIPAPT